MHWGHAVSEDLISWEEMPVAISPEDEASCNSGSAVVHDGRIWLFYNATSSSGEETIRAAYSDDGVCFTRPSENPVVTSPFEDNGKFREPFVFKYNNGFRMLVGAGKDGIARVLQYGSEDLLNWKYKGELLTDGRFGSVIEVPQLVEADGKWIFIIQSEKHLPTKVLFASGDYVQYSSLNKKVASLMYFPATADKTNSAEDEMLFIEVENMSTKKKKQNLSVTMTFRLNMKKTRFSKSVYDAPKYTYELTIKAKPGQYDKVFESKESLKKYATVNFYVANKKGFQSSAWGKKANISKLKASVEKDGCTYYTKDDIIDRLWEHHEGLLTSIDKGMVWMNVSLADVGVNWKKD